MRRALLIAARKVARTGQGRYGYYFSGACGGCAIFTFMPLVWASGGRLLAGPPEHQRPMLVANKPLADALAFYHRLVSEKLVPPQAANDAGASQFTPFESGKVAMFSTGSFGVSTFRQDAPHLHWQVTPIPGEHGGDASFAGGDEIAVTRSSKHRTAAWEFVKWATSALHVLRLQNSLLGLTLVYITFQLPFALFVMRTAFSGVPRELEDAAAIAS